MAQTSATEAPQQARGAEAAAEAAQEPGDPPRDHHHGQAGLVSRRGPEPRPHPPPPTRGHARQQPRRKLAPGHPTTRANAAKVQEPGLSPEVPRHPRRRLQHVQSPSPSCPPIHAPSGPGRGSPDVGGRDGCCLIHPEGGAFCGLADLTCQFLHDRSVAEKGRGNPRRVTRPRADERLARAQIGLAAADNCRAEPNSSSGTTSTSTFRD